MKDEDRRQGVFFSLQPSAFSLLYSLRWRFFLTLMGVAVAAVTFVSLFATRSTTNAFGRYVLGNMERDRWAIAHLLESQLPGSEPEEAQLLVNAIGEAYGRPITVSDAEGRVFVGTVPFSEVPSEEVFPPARLRSLLALNFRAVPFEDADMINDPAWEVVPDPLEIHEADLISSLNAELRTSDTDLARAWPLAAPLVEWPAAASDTSFALGEFEIAPGYASGQGRMEGAQSFIDSVNLFFWLAAVGAVVMAGVLSLGLSQRILRPVQRLTEAARRMETGDLNQRVAVSGKDEISELGHAFNAMAGGLQRQEQLRRNMVTDIAHELRTPLANVRGYLEAVQDGVIAADEGTLGTMHEEVVLLARLVDDLQELSLAEAGQLRLDLRPVAIPEIIEPAIKGVRPAAQAKGITLEADLPDDLPPVTANVERTGQVLRNLLQNALAHTPPAGRVVVSVRSGGAGEIGRVTGQQSIVSSLQTLDGEVVIAVADNGPGIREEHLPFIFERFYRADTSRTRATGGSGLGLAIAKALVEMQGGRIWVESQAGVETTFCFTLPSTRSEDV
jgi:signal transduction histidine kinase